ncbi:heavy-metal-associated domain-containing protein [Lutispora thermophila]|uniref:Heavy-metal-associated domain-containing protein n=1 Tax=Lutispora thermophila DSM 19022 TaxID=1122184 RepID=A0A1M6IYC2_9FIRM|nr:heavy metal-associated domain-containing protein [Lutispora thermophila]SHJ39423.1 Heavy-metal-associated domain-containing protein [Lutispora thermophila DSM 19022]
MINRTFQLETLTCPNCAAKIETVLKKMKGVKDVEVLFSSSRAKVSFEEDTTNQDEIKKTIESLGYDVLGVK